MNKQNNRNLNLSNLEKLEIKDSKEVRIKIDGTEIPFEIKKVNVGLIERFNDLISPFKTNVSLKKFNAHKSAIEKLRKLDDEQKLEDYMISNEIISSVEVDNVEDLVALRKELISSSTDLKISDIDKYFNPTLLRELSTEIYEFSK